MNIVEATDKDMAAVRALFCEYQASLGIDLCFQGFEQELATLPGNYAPPHGASFLAVEGNVIAGCVGIRPRVEVEAVVRSSRSPGSRFWGATLSNSDVES